MGRPASVADLAGYQLGTREVGYEQRDAALYALAVGAGADDLDLIYDRRLRVLPGYAMTLGLWGIEALGDLGLYDRRIELHIAQSLTLRQPLPPAGRLSMRGFVSAVWDKGKAAVVDITVSCDSFDTRYRIYLPGMGGWGGERGPGAQAFAFERAEQFSNYRLSREQAVLYHLAGDPDPIHVDPDMAAAYGFERPIMQGLCVFGVSARVVAQACGAHPCDLREFRANLVTTVHPGDLLQYAVGPADEGAAFEAVVVGKGSVTAGWAQFADNG